MDINLTPKLKTMMKGRPRVRGRYNSSELYGMTNGWITPEQWFNQPEKDLKSILSMWGGIGMHNQLEELMGKENSEKKIEYSFKDIILVAKGDFFPPHKPHQVWEFKTSAKVLSKSKPWHEYQARLYASIFERQQAVIFQPVQIEDGLFLKELGVVERDDKWFQGELEKLYKFHLEVEKLWEAKKK